MCFATTGHAVVGQVTCSCCWSSSSGSVFHNRIVPSSEPLAKVSPGKNYSRRGHRRNGQQGSKHRWSGRGEVDWSWMNDMICKGLRQLPVTQELGPTK